MQDQSIPKKFMIIKEYIDKNGGVIEVREKVCLYLDKKL